MPRSSRHVLLSALADESAFDLTAVEQFTAMAALGLEYYSLRFIDVGKGIKNVMDLTKSCLLYTSPSPRDATLSRMPSSA